MATPIVTDEFGRRGWRSLAVVGVPWSADELAVAVRAARAVQARVLLLDTAQRLASVTASENCLPIPVAQRTPELIAEALAGHRTDQVVAITELEMVCAAQVRELLGLPGTSSTTERAVIDKHSTRQRLAAAGLTGVAFVRCPVTELQQRLAEVALPAVVKPRSFTGSHGVQMVRDHDDVDAAVQRVLAAYDLTAARSEGNDEVLIESLVPGPEFSAEAMVVDGTVRLLALTDKVTLRPPVFFEVGHLMPSRYTEQHGAEVLAYLQAVASALDVRTSPLHAELKLTGADGPDGGVELIELHTRFGGGTIVRLLAEAAGIDAYKEYFVAVLDLVAFDSRPVTASLAAGTVRGVAFFGARPDVPLSWPSFDLPCPSAVVSIDYDSGRVPAVRSHRGIHLQHWRPGSVRLAGGYAEVRSNIEFVASIVQQLY